MSDVEKLYVQLQAKMQGNIPFEALAVQDQVMFTQAVNYILQVCSQRTN